MPSPLGHAIAGIAAGWVAASPFPVARQRIVQAAWLAGLAMAPDLDLLIGRHSGETHSLGAAALAASAAALWRWPVATTRWGIWLAVFAAWSSHPLLDALSPDNSPPIGVMAFWPVSHSYVQTGLAVFAPIWRWPFTQRMLRHDVYAVGREIAILTPLLIAVMVVRRRSRNAREARQSSL
jgi:membrane-bound metal-dependent hydrolase YbcI (DUF457 family)